MEGLAVKGRGLFYSCALDEAHLRMAVHYVDRNLVLAEIVERADDYSWLIAALHCRMCSEALLLNELRGVSVKDD
jgi:hypothetical protein